MSEEVEVKQPKLQGYCAALYDAFTTESSTELIEGVEFTVWRGKLTHTARNVGIPEGTYKRVMNQLTAMNCVEQVERGFRGDALTAVILHRPPTSEVWQDEIRGRGLTRGASPAILDRRITDLERRLGGIDVVQALQELQKQIDDVKSSTKQTDK